MSYQYALSGGTTGLQSSAGTASVASCSDWAGYRQNYDEFRVLGFTMDYLPHTDQGSSQLVQGSGLVISTHNATDPSPFTSLQQMVQYADWKPFYTGKSMKTEWKMSSTEEAQFASTQSSPASQGFIVGFVPTASSTGTYGNWILTFAVQFRGRF
jgi:hypothetical protein